ncbi:MAG TPA: VanZ family protein [Longimicrobiales bacterium]
MTIRPLRPVAARLRGWNSPPPARIALGFFLGCILLATLFPSRQIPPPTPVLCLVCGDAGLSDVLANIILFFPFGAALAALGSRARRALLFGVTLSFSVELAQHVIPGRDPSLSDVVFNTLGAGLGARAWRWVPLLLRPTPALASRLARAAALAAAAVLGFTTYALAPAFPDSVYYAQWTPDLGHLTLYEGRVLDARIGSLPLPPPRLADSPRVARLLRSGTRLHVRAVAGPRPPALASIFSIYDEQQREVILVGADREDLVVRVRTRAQALRLDHPDLRLAGALARIPAGGELAITVRRQPGRDGYCVELNGVASCGVRHPLGIGWALLFFSERFPEPLKQLLTVAWVAALVCPAAFWARSGRDIGLAAGIIAAAFLGAPAASVLVGLSAPDLAGAAAGLLAAAALRRAFPPLAPQVSGAPSAPDRLSSP